MREESNKKQLWETGALFLNESNKRMWKAGILSPNGCSVRNIDEKALEDAAEESLEKGFHWCVYGWECKLCEEEAEEQQNKDRSNDQDLNEGFESLCLEYIGGCHQCDICGVLYIKGDCGGISGWCYECIKVHKRESVMREDRDNHHKYKFEDRLSESLLS